MGVFSSLPISSHGASSIVTYFVLIIFSVSVVVGAGIGLVPFLVGRKKDKGKLSLIGFLCCIGAGILWGVMALILFTNTRLSLFLSMLIGFLVIMTPVAVVFIILTCTNVGGAGGASAGSKGGDVMFLDCMAGPLQGQRYPIGAGGLLIGRDVACAVRMPDGTPGISSRHCRIYWQSGDLLIQDLGSSYGTYMGNGARLPAEYPSRLAEGSRFYLGNPDCMFQIIRG